MCFFVFGEPSLFSEDNDKRKIILLIERSTRFHLSLSFCKMRRRFCEKEARASLTRCSSLVEVHAVALFVSEKGLLQLNNPKNEWTSSRSGLFFTQFQTN